MTEAVRRVTPEEFDWAAPSRVAGAVRAVVEAAEKADGAADEVHAALGRGAVLHRAKDFRDSRHQGIG